MPSLFRNQDQKIAACGSSYWVYAEPFVGAGEACDLLILVV
jgi:hypothetical protein